jgi:hypothetical protein
MATKTTKAASAFTADVLPDPPAPPPGESTRLGNGDALAAPTHPPITDFVSVWVHHQGVALANNQTGFVTVLKTDADTMIANGDAIPSGDLGIGGPFITPQPPAPPPPPAPAPQPDEPDEPDEPDDDDVTEGA